MPTAHSIQKGLAVEAYHEIQGGVHAAFKPIASDEIEQLALQLQKAIDEVRSISRELRAEELPAGGLIEALAHLAEVIAEDLPCEFICEKPVFVRDSALALAIFRIAEESVRNAVQHAKAKNILISLTESARSLKLTIDDDGSGFPPPACEETLRGIGLMYRRARVSGGKLTVNSRTGGGTKVLCTWAKTG